VDDDDDEDESPEMDDSELITHVNAALGRVGNNAQQLGLTYLRDIRRIRRVKNRWQRAYEELREEFPEGHLTFVGEEADALRQLLDGRKLDPKKLVSLIGQLENDLATERTTNLKNSADLLSSRIAEATGYTREAIDTVLRNGNMVAELRDTEVDGTGAERGKKVTKKLPWVRAKGDDKAAWSQFDGYVTANQNYMWGALKPAGTKQNGSTSGTTTVIDSSPAPRDGTTSGSDPVKEMLEKDKERSKNSYDALSFSRGRGGASAARVTDNRQ